MGAPSAPSPLFCLISFPGSLSPPKKIHLHRYLCSGLHKAWVKPELDHREQGVVRSKQREPWPALSVCPLTKSQALYNNYSPKKEKSMVTSSPITQTQPGSPGGWACFRTVFLQNEKLGQRGSSSHCPPQTRPFSSSSPEQQLV